MRTFFPLCSVCSDLLPVVDVDVEALQADLQVVRLPFKCLPWPLPPSLVVHTEACFGFCYHPSREQVPSSEAGL